MVRGLTESNHLKNILIKMEVFNISSGNLFEAYAKWPKFDVFIAHSAKDEAIVTEIKEILDENGITYTTPADYWKAKEYILTSVGPSPIRDSYFFLLIDDQENINVDTIQDWLWHAAQLNKSLLVLNPSERGKRAFSFDSLIKDQLMELISQIETEQRDPKWVYGKRRMI